MDNNENGTPIKAETVIGIYKQRVSDLEEQVVMLQAMLTEERAARDGADTQE